MITIILITAIFLLINGVPYTRVWLGRWPWETGLLDYWEWAGWRGRLSSSTRPAASGAFLTQATISSVGLAPQFASHRTEFPVLGRARGRSRPDFAEALRQQAAFLSERRSQPA